MLFIDCIHHHDNVFSGCQHLITVQCKSYTGTLNCKLILAGLNGTFGDNCNTGHNSQVMHGWDVSSQ